MVIALIWHGTGGGGTVRVGRTVASSCNHAEMLPIRASLCQPARKPSAL